MYVYLISFRNNKRFYIGSAVDVAFRWNRHLTALRKGQHPNRLMQSVFTKYGEQTFTCGILSRHRTEAACRRREQKLIYEYWPKGGVRDPRMMNLKQGAIGGTGIFADPEVKERHRQAQLDANKNPDVNARRSASLKASYRDPEVVSRRNASRNDPAVKAKMLASYKSTTSTPEWRAEASARAKAQAARPEVRHKKMLPRADSRPVRVGTEVFPMIAMAARACGLSSPTLLNRIASPSFPDFSFV